MHSPAIEPYFDSLAKYTGKLQYHVEFGIFKGGDNFER
jgi:hypothetical protein